jgi:alpha,alpha-trehalose phosphorylase
MIHHERVTPPHHIYPPDEWNMIEKQFTPQYLAMTETIFSTGNGYLGMRGCFEDGTPVVQNGTFINGFYESWPIVYGEDAYGFARTGQTIVNITDSRIIRLYVDDEAFYLPRAALLSFDRRLNMKEGTLDREILWETPSGKQVSIKSRGLVSFEHRHLAAIYYEITVLNSTAPVVISSEMACDQSGQTGGDTGDDPRKARGFQHQVLLPQMNYAENRRIVLCHRTNHSRLMLACGIDHQIDTECSYRHKSKCSEESGQVVFSIDAQPGKSVRLMKYMAYITSGTASSEEVCARVGRLLDRSCGDGFDKLLAGQKQYMDDFWRRSDVEIIPDPEKAEKTTVEIAQAIRFNLFHILQASGRAEGTGVAAKGLTGQAYEGQYFWDMEIYIMPFLIYTAPRIARNLLIFRYHTLEKARQRAQELHHKGAMFAWRTINGEEASAYYAAGTAQYHINADIMYALKKYVDVTGDIKFLHDYGAEMLVETARLWSDLGFYSERKGVKFCIHGVTGPDEYTTVVNNNTFTNLMAQENLRYAAMTVESLRDDESDVFQALVHKTELEMSEVEEWKKAADNMYIPYDEKNKIHLQDDGFLDREKWDFDNTPPEKYPLLLSFHPLDIYRYQVLKQADVVMAMFLHGDKFSLEEKKRNFEYYDPLTTGDSSLSSCIQSIMAAELGYFDKALEYGRYAALMDLADIGGNVKDGCHIASMGGTWMIFPYGFAGMRDYDGRISFKPRIPERWQKLRFPLTIRGQQLLVDIDRESATYLLRDGLALVIEHEGEEIKLSKGVPVTKKLSYT